MCQDFLKTLLQGVVCGGLGQHVTYVKATQLVVFSKVSVDCYEGMATELILEGLLDLRMALGHCLCLLQAFSPISL